MSIRHYINIVERLNEDAAPTLDLSHIGLQPYINNRHGGLPGNSTWVPTGKVPTQTVTAYLTKQGFRFAAPDSTGTSRGTKGNMQVTIVPDRNLPGNFIGDVIVSSVTAPASAQPTSATSQAQPDRFGRYPTST